jgi:hypothetical protein
MAPRAARINTAVLILIAGLAARSASLPAGTPPTPAARPGCPTGMDACL